MPHLRVTFGEPTTHTAAPYTAGCPPLPAREELESFLMIFIVDQLLLNLDILPPKDQRGRDPIFFRQLGILRIHGYNKLGSLGVRATLFGV